MGAVRPAEETLWDPLISWRLSVPFTMQACGIPLHLLKDAQASKRGVILGVKN